MDSKTIKTPVDNAIRSMYQMIASISSTDWVCTIVDRNMELSNISFEMGPEQKTGSFADIRDSIRRNIHPVEREAFLAFTDRPSYIEELKKHVHVSMECRLRHIDRRYYWSEIVLCNTTEEDSTEGNDCLLLIRDINTRKSREIRREAEERAVLGALQDKYDALFEENMKDQQTYTIGASFGWVLLPAKEDMTSLDEYVEMADAKMYEMRVARDKYRRD